MFADPMADLTIGAADKAGKLALIDAKPLQGIAKLGGGHRSVNLAYPETIS